ncbi:MAG TPA: hypothetical protein VKO43_02330 [Candidatus Krumholzibacteriaceae bacterium]|nr:hypothetical protein [Candidatus Krumholzibacteriaceae bacterium]
MDRKFKVIRRFPVLCRVFGYLIITCFLSISAIFSNSPVLASSSGLISHLDWSAACRNKIELYRNSSPFSWNENSHSNDEIVLMAKSNNIDPFDIFVKCSTGRYDAGSSDYTNLFYLKQGHIGLDLFSNQLSLKAYLRERVYNSGMLLLPFISNDSPYLTGNSAGLDVGIDYGGWFDISYKEVRISEGNPEYSNGGIPDFNDPAGSFRHLHTNLIWRDIIHFGISASEIQSIHSGNAVTFGFSNELTLSGVRVLAEFSEKINSSLMEISRKSFTSLDWEQFENYGFSGIFPDNSIFSMELQGAEWANPSYGSILLVPSYRYYGVDYSNPEGEIQNSLIESYLLCLWRHPRLAASFRIKGGDIYIYGLNERFKYLRNTLSLRFKQGVALGGNLLLREGKRSSYIITLEDDNNFSRLLTTFRVDDCGGANRISFLSDGWVNISDSWILRNSLYLHRSEKSRYSISIEYRPSMRFLFSVSFGSFNPFFKAISLDQEWEPDLSEENRQICFFTRIWLGGIRD